MIHNTVINGTRSRSLMKTKIKKILLFSLIYSVIVILSCNNNYSDGDTDYETRDLNSSSNGAIRISGKVTDSDKIRVCNVRIVLKGDNGTFITKTDESGDYLFEKIKTGKYFINCFKSESYIYPETMINVIDLTSDLLGYNFKAVDFYSDEKIYSINEIQGRTHISLYNSKKVTNVFGVTLGSRGGVGPYGNYKEIYIQNPNFDEDDRTSEGIKIWTDKTVEVSVGDLILVKEGIVYEDKNNPTGYEEYWTGNLTRTQINTSKENIIIMSKGNMLPKPVLIGREGRRIPSSIVCNDAVNQDVNDINTLFDPEEDAIDFFESLEGMFVEIRNALVTGPYNEYDELYVVPDNGESLKTKSVRSGALLTNYDNTNPTILKIIKLTGSIKKKGDKIDTGTIYNSPLRGIMDYTYGSYTVYTIENVSDSNPYVLSNLAKEITELESDSNVLTIAGFNLENFSAESTEIKINGIVDTIVNNLKSPDIIGVVEVQDDSGDIADGEVDSSKTLKTIINCIKTKTDSELYDYSYRYINPLYGVDGGAPGANIRVAFLFNKKRVTFIDRPGGEADTATVVTDDNGKAKLSFSPGRIDPQNEAFISTRKSLIGEFIFNNEKVYVIINHFSSKRGDYPIFGNIQPPLYGSEAKRHKQAEIINHFVRDILLVEPDANIVMVGDYNDYQFSKTLDILKGSELYNLIDRLPLNERYSYIHSGYSQTLDHILVSGRMIKRQPLIDVVRCFTEIGYAEKSVFSDHEPVISSFVFGTIEADLSPPEWISGFPKIEGVTSHSMNIYSKINEKGFIYFVLIKKEDAIPSVSQVKQGLDGNNNPSLFSEYSKCYPNSLNMISINNLEEETDYILCMVAEDDEKNPNVMGEINALSFKTMTAGGLIKNHSFEDNYSEHPDNWNIITSGQFCIDNTLSYDGQNSCYFETLTTSISGREALSSCFDINKDSSIKLSAYFYTPVDVDRTKVSLKVYFYSDIEGKTSCGNLTMISLSLKERDKWENIEYSIDSSKIPPDAKTACISVRVSYVKDKGLAEDRVYIDNFNVINQ